MFKKVMIWEEGKVDTTEKPKVDTTENSNVKTKDKQATVKDGTFNPDAIKVFSNFNEFMDLIMND